MPVLIKDLAVILSIKQCKPNLVMETFKKICITILMVFAVRTYSQEFIASNAMLSKESENCNSQSPIFCRYFATEVALLKLNEQNDEFSIYIPLFSILTSPKGNDSIANLNKNIYATFIGKFPVSNLDFYESNATESAFSFPGELTINGITKPINISMGIFASTDRDEASRGIDTYPVRISFTIEIDPGEFKLDFETINFINSIIIEVRNGVINKSTENQILR